MSEADASSDQEFLNSWFPDLDSQSYIIPVGHVDHFQAEGHIIGDVPASKLLTARTNDQDPSAPVIPPIAARKTNEQDETHKIVHSLFTKLKDHVAKGEVMVMMTQASFSMYSSILDAASASGSASGCFPWKYDHSDLVIVNKQRGILVGVVQSVHFSDTSLARQKLKESVAYLAKAASIIQKVVRRVSGADNVAVHTTLVLTNITRRELTEKSVQLQNAVQGVPCLCKNGKDLDNWWHSCWPSQRLDFMDTDVYRNLVKEFAIPATRVEIHLTTQPRLQLKHEHDFVNAVGEIHGAEVFQAGLHQLSLFPEQAELLNNIDEFEDDVKFLWGPPGTGKTISLVLRALQWVKHFRARRIFILQTRQDGTAASCLIEYQLQQTLNAQQQRAQQSSTDTQSAQCTFTHVDISGLWIVEQNKALLMGDWKETLHTALGLQKCGQSDTVIHIVADEADGEIVAAVYQWLKNEVMIGIIRLWAAGVEAFRDKDDISAYERNTYVSVSDLIDHSDSVVRSVKDKSHGDNKCKEPMSHYYEWIKEADGRTTIRAWPAGRTDFPHKNIPASLQPSGTLCKVRESLRCPGPVVREVTRAEQLTEGHVPQYQERWQSMGGPPVVQLQHKGSDGHTGDFPWRCGQCVTNIASKLKSLHVGKENEEHHGLSANDVFILGSNLDCDLPDDNDRSPAPLIKGLQDNGYNVCTLSRSSTRDEIMTVVKRDVKPPAITVADEICVWGLERKIVVYCETADLKAGAQHTGRLWAFSRSTSLLIYIST